MDILARFEIERKPHLLILEVWYFVCNVKRSRHNIVKNDNQPKYWLFRYIWNNLAICI